ncbi:MAG: polyphenol oxidase family protein, partial [Acetatifactor sp.]|nr:polyphenol oxidase family protein [Acetatifactor sp.]
GDVAMEFLKTFGEEVCVPGKNPDKYQLDLWLANLLVLQQAGIPKQNIAVTDICTCHNPDILFSHRASKGKRGNLGAFLMLKK